MEFVELDNEFTKGKIRKYFFVFASIDLKLFLHMLTMANDTDDPIDNLRNGSQ